MARSKTKKKPEKQTTVMYIGPSRPAKLVLKKGTVYRGQLPGHVSQAIQDYPVLAGLFVPVEKLGGVRQELRNPQSAVSVQYRKAAKLRK